MNTEHLHHTLSPQEYAALVDAAKLRAMQLRREAIRGFVAAAAVAARRAWRTIVRSVTSLRGPQTRGAGMTKSRCF